MDLQKLVEENELLIEKFNIKAYMSKQDYAVVGALCALEVTNEVQKYFSSTLNEKKEISEKLMHLYGLLQSLFVSIDGLYELAYLISGSKKFININQNKDLRNLKHIRNDVVGHPANRNTRSREAAYCILDKNSVTNTKFTYLVCKQSDIIEKDVELLPLVEAYYIETNSLLKALLNMSNLSIGNEHLITLISNICKKFPYQDYLLDLDRLYSEYLEKHGQKEVNNRFNWRYELIKKIENFHYFLIKKDLKDDVIYLQLAKLYNIISAKNLQKTSHGDTVKLLYRFMRKNLDLYNDKIYLCDMTHPYFNETLNRYIKRAKNNERVLYYLDVIAKLADLGESDLVYAYALPIKNFKK